MLLFSVKNLIASGGEAVGVAMRSGSTLSILKIYIIPLGGIFHLIRPKFTFLEITVLDPRQNPFQDILSIYVHLSACGGHNRARIDRVKIAQTLILYLECMYEWVFPTKSAINRYFAFFSKVYLLLANNIPCRLIFGVTFI